MNLCLLGIHDFEIFNETKKLKSILVDHLKSLGWQEVRQEYGYKWINPIDNDITIRDWGMYRHETLESCIPITTVSKVCVDCSMVRLTYDVDKCIHKLNELINEKTNEVIKRKKAKEIRENYHD